MSTRLNKFIAQASRLSRRQADAAIEQGRVVVNGEVAKLGNQVSESDEVRLDGTVITPTTYQYVLLNKPVGYVCSRAAQDEKPTIYDLLPADLQELKTAGRLDSDSRGLVLLTNDGDYAQSLTHPSHAKTKRYTVVLDKVLTKHDLANLNNGVQIDDGLSNLTVTPLETPQHLGVTMREGRNRQIRRTFEALGYQVTDLYRTEFGPFKLGDLAEGAIEYVDKLSTP